MGTFKWFKVYLWSPKIIKIFLAIKMKREVQEAILLVNEVLRDEGAPPTPELTRWH